jgi:hypothetical protein
MNGEAFIQRAEGQPIESLIVPRPLVAEYTCGDCSFTWNDDPRDRDAGEFCFLCQSRNVERKL